MFAGTGFLLSFGLYSIKYRGMVTNISSLWSIGLGRISAFALIYLPHQTQSSGRLVYLVLLANTPQGLLSCLYLMYNGMFTSMLMEQEWQAFAHRRKPLRVSKAVKGQRSTYFLQLPYRYAIPLLFCSGLMHWLISQSIFLAHVLSYTSSGERNTEYDILTCGYSPIGIIFSISLGGSMVIALLLISMWRYKPGLPLARSRSSIIGAVCRRLPEDTRAATSSIMWGIASGKDGVARSVFSSLDVLQPTDILTTRYATDTQRA